MSTSGTWSPLEPAVEHRFEIASGCLCNGFEVNWSSSGSKQQFFAMQLDPNSRCSEVATQPCALLSKVPTAVYWSMVRTSTACGNSSWIKSARKFSIRSISSQIEQNIDFILRFRCQPFRFVTRGTWEIETLQVPLSDLLPN